MTEIKSVNYTLVIFMIITFILLLVIMIYSAMSAAEIKKSCDKDCSKARKSSTISAVVAGVAAFCMLGMVILYIFTNRKLVASHTADALKTAQQGVQQYANSPDAFYTVPGNTNLQ